MAYSKFRGTYRSANQKNRIQYYIYEPETDLRAILQITHGWKDYIERYEELIQYFTDHGIMVCGCDFIGHGRSSEENDRGVFQEHDGWKYLVKDVKKLTSYMKREYPDVPIFLYGHGMGSLVARLCCQYEDMWDGMIFSGTSDKQKYCKRAILATAILHRMKGLNHRSLFLEKLIYGRLNRKFRHEKDDLSWFSSDEETKNHYRMDECTQFQFTIRGYENIFKMLELVATKKWYQCVDVDLPILLVSGKEDPIGDFGKGIERIHRRLLDRGCKVDMQLYDGVRHELQSNPSHDVIFSDILVWMKTYIEGSSMGMFQ
ncbi:MAG: alpha/beta hydrolase [Clostridiales bacterium]|nr:alpha/beta hydrolase [Clostridiales bacterium]